MEPADAADVERASSPMERAPASERGSAARSPWTNMVLFACTVVSTFYVGAQLVQNGVGVLHGWLRGWVFAVPLLAILVTHEMGHWLQAKRHGVDASLPYFIPLPLPPLGTLGAVISMRGRIKSRDALFDIGASGPLAGMIVALPVLAWGLHLSVLEPIPEHGMDEGQSILYLLMKRIVLGPIPSTHDVFLHPTAFAGWAGLFMTMLNLVPAGQLDGGHVAYSLFGKRQDVYSRRVRLSLLVVGTILGATSALGALRRHEAWSEIGFASLKGANWIVWFVLLTAMTFFAGPNHPPTDDDRLSPGRRVVAWGTLLLFVLLFMPVPLWPH
jgi:membrane-associated protease RseP (regulator of RpoE activity)